MMRKLIYIVFSLCILSCATPRPLQNTVKLPKNQAHILNGVYYPNPYDSNHDFRNLLEFLKIDKKNVDSIQLEMLSDRKMQVTSFYALSEEKNVVKGKIKKGAFQIKNK